jgi:valyl-tRNA synthetase
MRALGCPQHQFVPFQNVHQAGIAFDQSGREIDNSAENLMETVCCIQTNSDLMQDIYV